MVRGDSVLTLPNPHRGEMGVNLLSLILNAGPHIARGLGEGVRGIPIEESEMNVPKDTQLRDLDDHIKQGS